MEAAQEHMLKDNCVLNHMRDTSRKSTREYKPPKVIYKLFPIFGHAYP